MQQSRICVDLDGIVIVERRFFAPAYSYLSIQCACTCVVLDFELEFERYTII